MQYVICYMHSLYAQYALYADYMQALEHNKQLQHVEPGEVERLNTKCDQRVPGANVASLTFETHQTSSTF